MLIKPKPMREPLRILLLQGIKSSDNYSEAALDSIEEKLTMEELHTARRFLAWLRGHNLTVGDGTIDLRFHEWTHGISPMPQEQASQWALKRAVMRK